jgi:signal transduction histidine kinase
VSSLRLRLILGSSLVAIVPIAIAMLLMGRRLEATVREEADARLVAALRVLRNQIGRDAGLLDTRVQTVARDPELRRQLLVDGPASMGLHLYLGMQQAALDLDYLCVLDTTGAIMAQPARMTDVDSLERPRATGLWIAHSPQGDRVALDDARPIRYRDGDVGLLRGGLLLDSLWLARLREASGVELTLWDQDGRMLASTLPGAGALPAHAGSATERRNVGGLSYFVRRDPAPAGAGAAVIHVAGFVPTARADAALAEMRTASLVLAVLAVALAIVLGVLWSRQVSRPVERLAEFSQLLARGEWDEPLELTSVRELRSLVEALERMRSDLGAYRERLIAGERQAAYGQMARRVAHEIKNPLTPIAISAADLKRSFEQQRPDFPQILEQAVRTIEQEVHALTSLIREFSELGRFPPPVLERCEVSALLADVGGLFAHELATGRLAVAQAPDGLVAELDRAQVRRALVNLVQNGLDATGGSGTVRVRAAQRDDRVELTVSDDGPGLPAEQRAQLFTPGFTTKAHGSGLGLTIVERIVSDHGGSIDVDTAAGRGLTITLLLPQSRGA